MREIPERYRKEINKLMWAFIWDGKVNQIKRDVCCLRVEEGYYRFGHTFLTTIYL
jgi:hypothetical protein